jgi:hypothetical protein
MIALIDDDTATRFYNEIDNASEEDRQQMADALLAWGEQKQKKEREELETHFSKLFTDDSYYQQINDNDPALSESLDPEATAKRASIHAYLEHQLNRPIDTANFEPERDAFAMQAFGQKNLNDGQLFDFIRGDYDWQKQRTEAINELQMQAVGKAITDSQLDQNRPFVDGMTEVFNQWQQKYPELVDGKNDAAFLSQGYKLYYDTINDLDTVRPQASKALSTLTSFTQGNATDEDMQSLANDFVGAPPEDRQKIYKYVTLAAQAGQIDRAGIEQFAVNMGQAFTRGFDFVPQGTLQMQEAGVNNWLESIRNGTQIWVPADGDLTKAVVGNAPAGVESDAWRQATVPEAETLIQSGQNVRESFKVVRELRNVAKTGVDPIRPVLEENSFWGTAERGAYGLSGSIPLMGATAVNPFLGVLAYQSTEYDRIMLENPDIDPQFAQGLALVEGAANAAIDRVQLSSISGRLPMFGRYLDRIASDGVRRTVKIGANVVEQNLQEGAQDLIAPVLETAVASLREDMPDKDFTKLMDDWSGQRAETFFATLPLALIGGGVATYQDIKNPSAELNATKLRMAGFGQDQVTFIQRAENPEEYDARIKMEWEKRTPENIKAGEQEVLNTIEKARTPGELDARMQRVTAPDGSEDIVVTSPDGKELLRTKSEQAALEAVRQHNEAQLLNGQFDTKYEPEELRQIINDRITNWKSQDSNNTLVMESEGMNAQQKLEQLQAAGNAAQIQELHNRIANSPLKDTPYDQINILGEASVDDVAEMVFKPLITINPNTRPENLREEIHHIGVKVALKNGSVTLDTLRGWLDATEKALPDIFPNLVRNTEGDIVESLAQVQAAYEDGKIDANEASNLPASFIDYIKNMMRTFAEVLRRAVALRGAFKDGALPAEYETFLADSVGLNQQARVDTARERVSNEVLTDTNYSIGTNPFPMEQKGKWWANEDFEQRGGRIVTMSPDEFLSQVRPLEVDEASRDNIDDLKNMMQSGRKLDPLAIYADGKEDGRHRATAAKELGMDTIPVLDFRANKPEPKGNDFSIGSRANAVSTDIPAIRASNATITGPANYSIGAFHGTPHKVDKFSLAKIGTGEGAQAYGYGLYFAQSRDVAKTYVDVGIGNRTLSEQSAARQIFDYKRMSGNLKEGRDLWVMNQGAENRQAALEIWNRVSRNPEAFRTGNLYTVDLDVEPEDLLDWDKPFSEQSPKVQAALAEMNPDYRQDSDEYDANERGQMIYARIPRGVSGNAKVASDKLLSAGIPGIRYLDGGSRSDGEGTYNYVVFDENLIRITEENGNRIPASQALAAPSTGATNYSIGMDLRGVQLGADLAQVWNKFPKSEVSLPDLPENATPDELRKLAEQALQNQPDRVTSAFEKEVVLHDVKNIKGKAEHFVSGQYRERRPEPNRVRTLHMLAHTIRNAMAYGSAGKNRFAYIYRYNDGTVHVVIVQNAAGKQAIQRQFTITQFDHDTSKQISGIRILRKKESGPQPTATPQPSPSSAIGASEEPATHTQINQSPKDVNKNYSIASQSEIDRVNRALGGMNRGPDERLKVYQRAKQKFSKLMAWNSDELAAMADTGSDDSQIRRTQILQGLGELDGILSVLPPEVRGRVGGYTKLAGIAPMDVLKDGVKVSEVSGMNGAIISAWMREGQNIGQAGKQVSLPPGYTATENLSTKRADKAIADFFRDRIKKIDTELEKVLVREYTEAITKAVKQSRPKAGDNGVRKSTLGAETQKFADMVQRATLLDDEATPKRMAEIEAALTNPDATAEDISALSEEWSILNTFGDLDNRSSETLAQGLDWLKGQLQMGREAWRIKEQARIDEQRARAAATIEWLGKGTAKKRNATKTKSELASDLANHYLLSHANFEQFVTAIFPPEIASRWAEKLRKADEASQTAEIRDRKGILDAVRAGAKAANMSTADALLWLKGDQKNAVAYLEGRKVKDERIAIDLAQKIVTGEADRSKLTDADIETLRNELAALPADTQKEYVTIKRVIFRGNDVKLDMSRGKAMQYLLSWNQPDVQIKMRKEGWTDESAADLKALVNDPVSREVMAYAKELYGKGAGIVNPVYSRMFGMNMPQVKNYAPTRFLNAKDSKDIGLDGSATATGTTPGFAKSRVTHSAKIAPEDALTVMQGHIAQQSHWVHFAELAREFRAILSNPEVRESIKQTQGESVLKDAELWADQMEQRGGNKARESTWMNTILGTVLSGKAISSLGFNLKTLAMQLENTIRFGLALDMKQIVSALSNPSAIVEDIQTVWDSPAIQNRLEGGATAEARFLFSRYAGKPNFAAKIAEASMTPINWLDSAGTSISSAIVYRANLNDALASGMPENLAKQAALNAASEAIYRFAQPVSFGQKSIMENNGNVLAKTFFLFMSDPRLKTAILADAARGLATGRGNASEHIRRIVTVELMAIVSHVISSAFRDTFSDDDDEEIWNLGGFAKAILLAPLQGFFFAGTVGELAISKLTGQKFFSSTQNPLLTNMEQAIRAGTNMEDAINFDDPDAMLKEWNNIFRSMALAPWLAAPAVLLNMIKPVYGLYQNATTED